MKGKPTRVPQRRGTVSRLEAEGLAASAFMLVADDPERLGRFLAVTGLEASAIRRAAESPDFLAAVLGFLMDDEELLVAVAGQLEVRPERLADAARVLGGVAEEP